MMMNLIAEITTGGTFPDGKPLEQPQRVIYQCSEDGVADTIKPRLEEQGADCSKVAFINEEVNSGLTLDDERIRDAIVAFRPRLVVIDPIQAYLYSITKVSMTIIQPRLENISTFECSVEELLDWAENYVRPRARLAFEGKGEQVPGDWCRFCSARTSCNACADEALALVKTEFLDLDSGVLADEQEETDATAAYDPDTTAPTFKSPALLSKTDIEKMLPTLNRIESWIEAIFAYVSSEAINHGVCWDGYKVVEGRSKRQFLDPKAVAGAATQAGYTDIYKTEMISLTEFEKLMGKKKFQEVLGEYVVKPPGKLALVPDSDPRPAVDLDTAADEFTPLE